MSYVAVQEQAVLRLGSPLGHAWSLRRSYSSDQDMAAYR